MTARKRMLKSNPFGDAELTQQTEKEFLQQYNIHEFDIPLTSVDMAIFTIQEAELKVLLVKRSAHPAMGRWALPGGFINLAKDSDLDETAARKLKEKTSVEISHLEQVASFGSAHRDPRGWSVTIAYMALIASDNIKLNGNESLEEVNWVSVNEAAHSYSLAFDHLDILKTCHERLKSKVHYTSMPINLLPDSFTLSELQSTFEIILGDTIEKKSFRRRVLDAEIIEETGEMKTGSNRPAKLYKAKSLNDVHLFKRSIEGSR
jgi:ADP-ribose pyrophosphatase YjhB (NUDIX family)